MNRIKELSKRLVKLKEVIEAPEPAAIICEPGEANLLRGKYPRAVLLIDNIPKENIS